MCTFKICAMVSFAQACPRVGQKSEFQLVLRVTFERRCIIDGVIIQLAMSFPNVLFNLLFLSEEGKEDEIIPPGQLHCEVKHRGLAYGSFKVGYIRYRLPSLCFVVGQNDGCSGSWKTRLVAMTNVHPPG